MENFGTYLLRTGAVSSAQLDEATQSQIIFGGRLGTNLAELGYLGLDDLRQHLSNHLAIPLPNPEWIAHPNAAVRESFPKELVEKFRVLPLQIEKGKLHLAMIDPRDPIQLDQIAFAMGRTVIPYVLPEVELFALIERGYGVQREIRYINLGREAARGNRQGPESKALELEPITDGDSGAVVADAQAENEDLIGEDLFVQLHQRSERRTRAAVEKPAGDRTPDEPQLAVEGVNQPTTGKSCAGSPNKGIATLEAGLACAPDRDALGDLALRIARCYTDAAALFAVRGEIISGLRGDGDRISEDISGILLAATFDSVLTAPVRSQVAFRGTAPNEGVGAQILSSLGRGDAQEVAVFPVLIRGEVVNLLYTDSGSDVLGETGFTALETLASLVSCAYERLILERKSGHSDK